MLNFFYKFVTPFKKTNKMNMLINKLIEKIVNFIYPIYCKTAVKNQRPVNNVIVSLTTYPERIKAAYYCINTLIRQTIKPKKIILWLALDQFPQREDSLPKKFLRLKKYGLTIQFCDDLKSYKKIFYTAQKYSDHIIVTADDDVLYPENWLEELLETHAEYKNEVVCYRAHEITIKNNQICPYSEWNGLSKDLKGPSMKLIAIGVGGILYPKNFFSDIELDWNVIKEMAPTTDDIWLKILQITKKFATVKVNINSKEWFGINKTQKNSLRKLNLGIENKNDIAIKKLMLHYNLTPKDFSDL